VQERVVVRRNRRLSCGHARTGDEHTQAENELTQ